MAYQRVLRWIACSISVAILGASLTVSALAASPPTIIGTTAFYVSASGSDSNPGTQSAPFKTFTQAVSVLQAGDTLNIAAGTYNEAINVSKSGMAGSPITIQPESGGSVVIDLLNQSANNVSVTGSYVTVKGLELRNSSGYCVNLQGSHNTLQASVVHDCHDMGIYTDGQDETIEGNTVYHATDVNSGFTLSSGWGSGIKVHAGGNQILIARNTIYNNYGDGIAVTRGANVTVEGNQVYDNYSVNIYIDNSYNVTVTKNFAFNHPNNGFLRNGVPADNIALGEEFYSGWGAQLSNVTIQNNVAYNGSHGVTFYGNDSGTAGGGLKNSTIAFNTLWGSYNSEISIAYDTGQTANLIADNIVQQSSGKLALFSNTTGVTFSHNFWVNSVPPSYAQGAGDKTGDVKLASTPGYAAETFELSGASPAIDAGSSISGVVDDYAGLSRPQGVANDMGAYEYPAGAPSVAPTPTVASTPAPTSSPTPQPTPSSTATQPPAPIREGALTLSASSITFRDQLIGTTGSLVTATLSNSGTTAVTVNSITTAAPFVVSGTTTCPITNGTLAGGASCTIGLQFSPTTAGTFSGGVVIQSSAASSPNQISLAGTGIVGTQLVVNPGFEIDANLDGEPDNWTFANVNTTTDRRDCSIYSSGSCSLKLVGNGTSKTASQSFTQAGHAGDDFTFALASQASSIPASSTYRLQVQFFNGTTLLTTKTLNFASGTHGFQTVRGSFTASAAYTTIVFKITLRASSGQAWFDTSGLYWAP
ncbi:MAG TPA: right-handed parallel beta-helix repeat-containing protein [Anaerolineales bacterium]